MVKISTMKQLLILIFITALYACGSSDKKVDNLMDLGFINQPDAQKQIYEQLRLKYKKKYNLNFIGDSEMEDTLSRNGYVRESASQYIGGIPKDVQASLLSNYNSIDDDLYYWFDDRSYKQWNKVGEDHHGKEAATEKGVYIVAPPAYFKNHYGRGGIDPIAVVKVDGGWIELARWVQEVPQRGDTIIIGKHGAYGIWITADDAWDAAQYVGQTVPAESTKVFKR